MKKTYQKPEVEITVFESADVLLASIELDEALDSDYGNAYIPVSQFLE